ncbi:riboflavin kinase [Dendroctonus ponderosae]
MPGQSLPHFTKGEVVKGFGRGSKDLGIPTANFPQDVVNNLPDGLDTGVYYGFGQVDGGQVHGMVMSIGWNPFYKNSKKSMETHLMHKFESDFYGKELRVVILGYLRPEQNFPGLDALIAAIDDDIKQARTRLEMPDLAGFRTNEFFKLQPH